MNLKDYNEGIEAGLIDGRSGANNLQSMLRYIDNSGTDIDKTSFTTGYIVGQANVNSTC